MISMLQFVAETLLPVNPLGAAWQLIYVSKGKTFT